MRVGKAGRKGSPPYPPGTKGTKAKDDEGKMNLASTESLSSSHLAASKSVIHFHIWHILWVAESVVESKDFLCVCAGWGGGWGLRKRQK